MINGGFFKKTVNVVSGESGTGKTVFGAQFLYQGAMNGEKVLCIMITESAENFIEDMNSSFGWDFSKLLDEGMISFVDLSDPELRLHKNVDMLPSELIIHFKKVIGDKINKIQPERVFIDSLEGLFLAIDSHYELKTLVDDMFGVLRLKNMVCLITIGTTFEMETMMEYGADSVTRLGRVISGNNLQRSIYVAKKRGSRTINEIRVLNISDSGVKVFDKSPYTSTI